VTKEHEAGPGSRIRKEHHWLSTILFMSEQSRTPTKFVPGESVSVNPYRYVRPSCNVSESGLSDAKVTNASQLVVLIARLSGIVQVGVALLFCATGCFGTRTGSGNTPRNTF
jgi:hypothetical protein